MDYFYVRMTIRSDDGGRIQAAFDGFDYCVPKAYDAGAQTWTEDFSIGQPDEAFQGVAKAGIPFVAVVYDYDERDGFYPKEVVSDGDGTISVAFLSNDCDQYILLALAVKDGAERTKPVDAYDVQNEIEELNAHLDKKRAALLALSQSTEKG